MRLLGKGYKDGRNGRNGHGLIPSPEPVAGSILIFVFNVVRSVYNMGQAAVLGRAGV